MNRSEQEKVNDFITELKRLTGCQEEDIQLFKSDVLDIDMDPKIKYKKK
ncbi:hypothetical protein [Prochlorococcus marinus]|nr:hypothetical protein [Prochlorococcus marinus]